jgi:diguanylate cyclase (GGDEF)-like protein
LTEERRKEETREIVSNSNNLIIECAKGLSTYDFKKGIRAVLKSLGAVLKADRVYMVESKRGEAGDFYEWMDRQSGSGLPGKKEFEKYDIFTIWNKQLQGNKVAIIEDSVDVRSISEEIYEDVLAGNISRYAVAAISDKNDVIGYLIVDNYVPNLDVNLREVMESISIFISEELRNYNLAHEMMYMSTHDVLTDLGNRQAFSSTLKMIEGMNMSVGICYVDINGLKEVNDTKGHDAGDELIKEVANTVSSVYKKKYCYRIGGDEFIAIIPQIDAEYFSELTDKLRKKGKKIPMAIGAIWQDNAENIVTLINSADQLMYSDKAMYYQDGNERRH